MKSMSEMYTRICLQIHDLYKLDMSILIVIFLKFQILLQNMMMGNYHGAVPKFKKKIVVQCL